jgi:hypothetical protein
MLLELVEHLPRQSPPSRRYLRQQIDVLCKPLLRRESEPPWLLDLEHGIQRPEVLRVASVFDQVRPPDSRAAEGSVVGNWSVWGRRWHWGQRGQCASGRKVRRRAPQAVIREGYFRRVQ